MLILEKCRFVRVAKTGTQYCTKAILDGCESIPRELGGREEYHAPTSRGPQLPAFGFVRHPLTWYESYWRHRMSTGRDDSSVIDEKCRSDDFLGFLGNVLSKLPAGYLGRTFEAMLGANYGDCQFVGRFENLTADLVSALSFFGEPVSVRKILASPPRNVGDRKKFPVVVLPDEISEQLVLFERDLVARFYANCHILKRVLV